MTLYLLDLLGVAVFAVSGTLAAGRARLDLFGVIVIAAITAIGGGTLRDVLLDRHPIFWVRDPVYLAITAVAALSTVAYVNVYPPPRHALRVADALGLAVFAIAGAQIAETAGLSPIIVVLMGTITGVAGGVLRDLLTAEVPLILRADIYATAAIAGISLYLLLEWLGAPRPWAFGAGLAAVVTLRLLSIVWRVQLPVFRLPE
jgi:uncharacterized membrane protein YeiH